MLKRLDTLQKIEIAEGVEINLRPAGVLVRGGAFMLDSLIKFGIYIVLGTIMSFFGGFFSIFSSDSTSFQFSIGIMTLVAFGLEWIYSIAFEASSMAATPGKRAFKLKVAQLNGSPITFNQSVVRNLLRFIDLFPGLGATGMITMLSNRRFQRLGDLAAQTVVIYSGEVDLLKRPTTEGQLPPINLGSIRPTVNLNREEQLAIVMYSERAKDWTQPRLEELASYTGSLVTTNDSQERVNQLHGIARWIRSNQ